MLSKTKTLTLSILLTAILLYFLLSQIDLALVFQTIIKINPLYLLLGFLCYLSTYTFRTARFYLLLNKSIGFLELFRVVCLHNMFNNLLPARTGELSFIYLLKKFHGKEIGEATAVLIIARFFDFLIILVLFLISGLLVSSQYLLKYLLVFFILVLVFCLVLLCLVMFCNKIQSLLKSIDIFEEGLLKIMNDIIYGVKKFGASKSKLIRVLFLSLFASTFSYLSIYCILIAILPQVEFIEVVFASTFPILATFLPFQGIGGFGTIEASWVIGYILVGIPADLAIISGFVWHFVQCAYFIVLGVYGILFSKFKKP